MSVMNKCLNCIWRSSRGLRTVISVCILFVTMSVIAQTPVPITVPYSFGFEEDEDEELQNWVLNPGTQASLCTDQWIVGEVRSNGGRRAMYISTNGYEANFGSKPNVQYAYRDFTIEAGHYDCSFDYSCMGAKDATLSAGISFTSSLSKDMVAKAGASGLPASISPACLVKNLYGSISWKNTSFSFNATATGKYRIFFVWQNANTDTTLAVPVGACIDNIQITTTNCAKPSNLQADAYNDTVRLTWQGTSELYVFERRKRGTDRWYVNSGLKQKELILEGLSEGAYDFRVRGVCNDVDTSAYVYLNSYVVYYPDRHCIDYIHFNKGNIHGTIGNFDNPYMLYDTIMDYGEESKYSRHTLNTEPDKYDIRTRNQLRTIPEGEFASVRLGNWNVGGEAESMSFEFMADSFANALVLLKYAVVLEDPSHGEKDQPRFTMEILDEYGQLVDPTCGAADFRADATREGWHTAGDVTWKDWTTVGMNLMEMGLAGQTITIRFTTYDCNWSGHFGYAYFTLDCASATITSSSCGDDPVMQVNAPDGFDYTWYNEDGDTVAVTKSLSVEPSDTKTYRCHLTFVENKNCGFDLYTASKPRYPLADFEYVWEPAKCENRVRFINHSHVVTKFDGDEQHNYDEPCDEYQWDFGNGLFSPDVNPVIIFPNEGGDIPVTLQSSIAEGRCVDEITYTIHVPAIGDTEQTMEATICQGEWIVFGDKQSDSIYYAAEDGQYRVKWKSVAGCDSIWNLNLTTRPVSSIQTPDTTICAEEPLVIDGQTYKYSTSGKFYRFHKNIYGCDSTRWCNVTVLDSILPDVTIREMSDEPNSGAIFISGTGYEYYTVNGGAPQTADSITGLNGGQFVLEFFNDFGCSVVEEAAVSVCMPGWVYQRWDDVLSLKNAATLETDSAKHVFTDFQWYKEGEPIVGANLAYLYLQGGLDPEAHYHLEMTRVSNGEHVATCPFLPAASETKDVLYVYPSPVRSGGTLTIKVSAAANATIVNAFGEVVLTAALSEGENNLTINAPAGVYVVQVVMNGQTHVCHVGVID